MASITVRLDGSVIAGPPVVSIGTPLIETDIPLSELEQYPEMSSGVLKATALSTGNVIPFGGVTTAKFILILVNGLIALKLTPVAGVDPVTSATPQTIPVEKVHLTMSRSRAYTALTFDAGPTAVDVQYLIVGD